LGVLIGVILGLALSNGSAGAEMLEWETFLDSWAHETAEAERIAVQQAVLRAREAELDHEVVPSFRFLGDGLYSWRGARPEEHSASYGVALTQLLPFGGRASVALQNTTRFDSGADRDRAFRQVPVASLQLSLPRYISREYPRGVKAELERAGLRRREEQIALEKEHHRIDAVGVYRRLWEAREDVATAVERLDVERKRRDALEGMVDAGIAVEMDYLDACEQVSRLKLRRDEAYEQLRNLFLGLRAARLYRDIAWDEFRRKPVEIPSATLIEDSGGRLLEESASGHGRVSSRPDVRASPEYLLQAQRVREVELRMDSLRAGRVPEVSIDLSYAPSYDAFAPAYGFAESWWKLEPEEYYEPLAVSVSLDYAYTPGAYSRERDRLEEELRTEQLRRERIVREREVQYQRAAQRERLLQRRVERLAETRDIAERRLDAARRLHGQGELTRIELLEHELAYGENRREFRQARMELWYNGEREKVRY